MLRTRSLITSPARFQELRQVPAPRVSRGAKGGDKPIRLHASCLRRLQILAFSSLMGSAIRAFVYSSCCRRSPGFPSTLFRVHCHRKRRHQCCWLGVIHRLLLTEPFPANLAKLLLEAFWRRVSWLSPLSSLISVPTCRVFVAQVSTAPKKKHPSGSDFIDDHQGCRPRLRP
jgi:hypothetical protein